MRVFATSFLLLLFVLSSTTIADTPADIKMRVDSTTSIAYKFIVSNLQESVDIFTKNVELARTINYKYGEAVALDKLSLATGVSGEHDKSTEAAFRAMRLFEELNAVDELSLLYAGFGYGIKRRDLVSAQKYMWKGLKIAEKNDLRKNLTTIYDNYGIIKNMQGKEDSALHFFQKALELKYELKDTVGIPYSLNKIGQKYAEVGNYNEAITYFKKSDKYRAHEEGDFGRCENLINWAELYNMMNNSDLAIDFFKRGIKLGKKISYKRAVEYCYGQLTIIYEGQKKPGLALENYKKQVAYEDSVMNVETNTKISELQIAFETEKKDRQIVENEMELQNKSLQLYLAIGVVIMVIGSLIFTFWYYKQKQIRLKEELEFKNQLKQAELEKKINEEKLHISRELHDNIGSNLTFMISSIDNLEYNAKNDTLQSKLKKLSVFGRETIDDLRNSIWAIKKEAGDTDQLMLKITDLKQKINEGLPIPEILITNNLKVPFGLTSTQMLNLFRFVQEAVQNAIKHAEASQVNISISQSNKTIGISIEDNGKGFDVSMIPTGNGLLNMRNRCEDSFGEFNIVSSENGTNVSFSLKV